MSGKIFRKMMVGIIKIWRLILAIGCRMENCFHKYLSPWLGHVHRPALFNQSLQKFLSGLLDFIYDAHTTLHACPNFISLHYIHYIFMNIYWYFFSEKKIHEINFNRRATIWTDWLSWRLRLTYFFKFGLSLGWMGL